MVDMWFDNAILYSCAMLYLVNVNGEFYYTNNDDSEYAAVCK